MTVEFDGQSTSNSEIDAGVWLNVMEKEAAALRMGAVYHKTHGDFDFAQINFLNEIVIRMEMIYLVLRGGIDGEKEE